MKTLLQWVILFTFILAACAPSKAIPSTTTFEAPTQTKQPTPISSSIPIRRPTSTFTPPATITPNNPLSACPSGNSQLKPDFSQQLAQKFPQVPQLGEPILAFLNSGGTPQAVITALTWTQQEGLYDPSIQSKEAFNKSHLFEQDLTGDDIPEFVVSRENLYIFGCRNEKYEILLELDNDDPVNGVPAPWIIAVDDLNLDGLPEIIVKSYYGRAGERAFRVFEWRSDEFKSLLIADPISEYFSQPDVVEVPMGDILLLQDENKDGTKEIIIRGYEFFTYGLPSQGEQYTYTWNGSNFILMSKEYSEPIYRFQAVQDGDRYSLAGSYDKAITLYQDAIFSDKLDWWSDERDRYEVNCWLSKPNCPDFPTPPSPDPKEYYNLAAYSRFRIMLIYVLRGLSTDAEVVYKELQKQFPDGKTGHAYAEMARQFWNEYHQSGNMEKACNAAIEYAQANPEEILSYLGNGDYALTYFGEQSLTYTAKDVCPFK